MDIGTIIGVAGAFGMLAFSVIVAGQSLMSLIDMPSFLLVVIGSFFALCTASILSDALGVFGSISRTFKVPVFNEQSIIQKMVAFSEKARREGLLALEESIDPGKAANRDIFHYGMHFVVDGTDAVIIDKILSHVITHEKDAYKSLLMAIEKEAVLAIQEGVNPRIFVHLLSSYVDIPLSDPRFAKFLPA